MTCGNSRERVLFNREPGRQDKSLAAMMRCRDPPLRLRGSIGARLVHSSSLFDFTSLILESRAAALDSCPSILPHLKSFAAANEAKTAPLLSSF